MEAQPDDQFKTDMAILNDTQNVGMSSNVVTFTGFGQIEVYQSDASRILLSALLAMATINHGVTHAYSVALDNDIKEQFKIKANISPSALVQSQYMNITRWRSFKTQVFQVSKARGIEFIGGLYPIQKSFLFCFDSSVWLVMNTPAHGYWSLLVFDSNSPIPTTTQDFTSDILFFQYMQNNNNINADEYFIVADIDQTNPALTKLLSNSLLFPWDNPKLIKLRRQANKWGKVHMTPALAHLPDYAPIGILLQDPLAYGIPAWKEARYELEGLDNGHEEDISQDPVLVQRVKLLESYQNFLKNSQHTTDSPSLYYSGLVSSPALVSPYQNSTLGRELYGEYHKDWDTVIQFLCVSWVLNKTLDSVKDNQSLYLGSHSDVDVAPFLYQLYNTIALEQYAVVMEGLWGFTPLTFTFYNSCLNSQEEIAQKLSLAQKTLISNEGTSFIDKDSQIDFTPYVQSLKSIQRVLEKWSPKEIYLSNGKIDAKTAFLSSREEQLNQLLKVYFPDTIFSVTQNPTVTLKTVTFSVAGLQYPVPVSLFNELQSYFPGTSIIVQDEMTTKFVFPTTQRTYILAECTLNVDPKTMCSIMDQMLTIQLSSNWNNWANSLASQLENLFFTAAKSKTLAPTSEDDSLTSEEIKELMNDLSLDLYTRVFSLQGSTWIANKNKTTSSTTATHGTISALPQIINMWKHNMTTTPASNIIHELGLPMFVSLYNTETDVLGGIQQNICHFQDMLIASPSYYTWNANIWYTFGVAGLIDSFVRAVPDNVELPISELTDTIKSLLTIDPRNDAAVEQLVFSLLRENAARNDIISQIRTIADQTGLPLRDIWYFELCAYRRVIFNDVMGVSKTPGSIVSLMVQEQLEIVQTELKKSTKRATGQSTIENNINWNGESSSSLPITCTSTIKVSRDPVDHPEIDDRWFNFIWSMMSNNKNITYNFATSPTRNLVDSYTLNPPLENRVLTCRAQVLISVNDRHYIFEEVFCPNSIRFSNNYTCKRCSQKFTKENNKHSACIFHTVPSIERRFAETQASIPSCERDWLYLIEILVFHWLKLAKKAPVVANSWFKQVSSSFNDITDFNSFVAKIDSLPLKSVLEVLLIFPWKTSSIYIHPTKDKIQTWISMLPVSYLYTVKDKVDTFILSLKQSNPARQVYEALLRTAIDFYEHGMPLSLKRELEVYLKKTHHVEEGDFIDLLLDSLNGSASPNLLVLEILDQMPWHAHVNSSKIYQNLLSIRKLFESNNRITFPSRITLLELDVPTETWIDEETSTMFKKILLPDNNNLGFDPIKNYWLCCGQSGQDAIGCWRDYHSLNFDGIRFIGAIDNTADSNAKLRAVSKIEHDDLRGSWYCSATSEFSFLWDCISSSPFVILDNSTIEIILQYYQLQRRFSGQRSDGDISAFTIQNTISNIIRSFKGLGVVSSTSLESFVPDLSLPTTDSPYYSEYPLPSSPSHTIIIPSLSHTPSPSPPPSSHSFSASDGDAVYFTPSTIDLLVYGIA